jgi:nucleotide-binding universal stress UspA family protein
MAAAVVLDSQEGTRRKAKNLVDDAATRLRAARFEADGLVVEGDVSDALLDMAADWGADLIVLGSHGRRGLDRLLLGSVSEVVLRHTTCSVLIVRPPAAGADAAKRPGAGAAEYGDTR